MLVLLNLHIDVNILFISSYKLTIRFVDLCGLDLTNLIVDLLNL
jgi:hypothetical protein